MCGICANTRKVIIKMNMISLTFQAKQRAKLKNLFFFTSPYSCTFRPAFFTPPHVRGGRGPHIGEITCGGSPQPSCKRDQIKMRDYMDRQVTPPKRVTSATWGCPPPCEQALRYVNGELKPLAKGERGFHS